MARSQLDASLQYIGKYGRYQVITSVIVTILGTWLPAWYMMGLIFMADEPESYECVQWSSGHRASDAEANRAASPGDATPEIYTVIHYAPDVHNQTPSSSDASHSECTAEAMAVCVEWEYYTVYNESTIVTDFALVCDRKILAETSQSIFLGGMLVGSLVFGYLSDVFGRKIILLGTCLSTGVFGIAVAFLWSYISVVIFWFMIGMFVQGFNQVQFVMVMELFPANCRTLAGSLNAMFWGLGIVALTPIAFALRNWRHLQLAIAAPCFLGIPLWLILDEPTRWLLSKGRTKDAEKLLHKMARWNGVKSPSDGFLIKETTMEIQSASHDLISSLDPELPTQSEKNCTFLDVLRTRRVMLNLCIVCFAWFTSIGTYYGASLNSSNLAGNKYTNFLFLGLAEIPGYIIIPFTMRWWGRRQSLWLFFLISGAASITSAFLPAQTVEGADLTIAITVTAMLVKLGIVCAYSINLICCTEILPTPVRNFGFGVGAVCGSVGLITAPFVVYLDDVAPFLPMTIFGGLCIVAAILAPILPETRNKPLPETLADARNIGKKASKTSEPNTSSTPTTSAKTEESAFEVDAL